MFVEPCPFCGGKIDYENPHNFDWNQGMKWGFVYCTGCSATGPEVRTGYQDFTHWRDHAITQWNDRALLKLVNSPEVDNFIEGVRLEYAHQECRWGKAHDQQKTHADWFWTLSYLAGKALYSILAGDVQKAKHHTISSAALLCHWHDFITQGEKGGGG